MMWAFLVTVFAAVASLGTPMHLPVLVRTNAPAPVAVPLFYYTPVALNQVCSGHSDRGHKDGS